LYPLASLVLHSSRKVGLFAAISPIVGFVLHGSEKTIELAGLYSKLNRRKTFHRNAGTPGTLWNALVLIINTLALLKIQHGTLNHLIINTLIN
jgi:hypothetical protein